ncbi:MAG: tail assembly protein [Alphaproteobacteria bacterium]|nr:tail assembly protein [Alphaproteobacteria bacterium]
MATINLAGRLGALFTPTINLDVATTTEAIRALRANFGQQFVEELRQGSYRISRGEVDLGLEHLPIALGDAPLTIEPVVAGAKNGGVGKVILGAALIAISFYAPIASTTLFTGVSGAAVTIGGTAFSLGLGAVLGGITQMLTPTPQANDYSSRERPEDRPSLLFNGAVNTLEQGGAVPLIYGKHRVGSVVINVGLKTEQA